MGKLDVDAARELILEANVVAACWPVAPWVPRTDEDGEFTGWAVVDPDGDDALMSLVQEDYGPPLANHIASVIARDEQMRTAILPAALDRIEELVKERDEWKRRAAKHGCDIEKGDPDCG